MRFELKGVPKSNFQHLDDFFSDDKPATLQEKAHSFSLEKVNIHTHDWLFDGIRIGYSDWRYTNPDKVGWKYEIKGGMVTFQANMHGTVFVDGRPEPIFKNNQHNLFYSQGREVSEGVVVPDRLRTSMFLMQFTKDSFLRLTEGAGESLERFTSTIMKGQNSILSPENLSMSSAMMRMIQSIVNCPFSHGLKRMFLLSRSIEFLVHQAELCNLASRPVNRFIKTKRDEESVAYAREYVTKNLVSPPALPDLAKIVGINEYKLKRGFKEMYGTTVFGYISDARLEIAKSLILDAGKSVSEVADETGYASLQHFSAAFKKKFGIAPSLLKSGSLAK